MPRPARINRWLYKDDTPVDPHGERRRTPAHRPGDPPHAPASEEQVRQLKVGDVVLLNGPMHTGRDTLHHHLLTHDSPVDLRGAAIYHCGPVALKKGDEWRMNAAGPTTSGREEPYQADIIRKFGVRAVIGKGGMGAKTLAALKEHGAVYLNAIGGAAQYYTRASPKWRGSTSWTSAFRRRCGTSR